MSKVFVVSLKPIDCDNDIDRAIIGIFDDYEKSEKVAKGISLTLKKIEEELFHDLQENEGMEIDNILSKDNRGLLLSYGAVEIHEIELNNVDANFFPDQDAFNEVIKSIT